MDVKGDTGMNGVIKFRFADRGEPDMKVMALKDGEKRTRECIESPHGWIGNIFGFDLDDNEGKTHVRFTHGGFPEEGD
ncbi:MAG TPA: hypothetical protein PKM97_09575 [Bacteroidia bacterium]|nr:hypothetical protein [Bacteroidia bacterium]